MKPVLTVIAATDQNGLLANATGIPWHLPRDIAHFRASTRGKWLLLGRRTYEEMRGWFRDGDFPLVLTSLCGWDPERGRAVSSVPHALALAESSAQTEVVCCGGAQTYAAALPYADLLVLTTVLHRFQPDPGSVHFPAWDPAGWRETRTVELPRDGEHEYAFTIRWWERR